MKEFDTVIGLEVHVQLSTRSKIFCSCSTQFEAPPNTNICPVCCGYPGTLPVFNQEALKLGAKTAIALNCKISQSIYFERKNYFYPDLPKNYQISQYISPLGFEGFLKTPSGKKVGIERVHLEEDAGKLIHKKDYSLADFNRAGIALLEIVSSPDISSPQEAFDYLNSLKLLLQYIGASTCDMEKGYLRCDANISLKEKNSSLFGTKVELKNMNSFKGVRQALEYEEKRQARQLNQKEAIIQETRLWDADQLITIPMRSKEEAHDYRYFPDPDLPDFLVSKELIKSQELALGELPLSRSRRFLSQYQLSQQESDLLIENKELADFFEDVLKFYNRPKKVHKLIFGPFLEQVNLLEDKFGGVKISAKDFAKVVQYFDEGKINNIAVKKILSLALPSQKSVDQIIEAEQLLQLSDRSDLESVAETVLADSQKAVKEYQQGKQEAIQFLVGQMMRATRGRANPQIVKQILERRLRR